MREKKYLSILFVLISSIGLGFFYLSSLLILPGCNDESGLFAVTPTLNLVSYNSINEVQTDFASITGTVQENFVHNMGVNLSLSGGSIIQLPTLALDDVGDQSTVILRVRELLTFSDFFFQGWDTTGRDETLNVTAGGLDIEVLDIVANQLSINPSSTISYSILDQSGQIEGFKNTMVVNTIVASEVITARLFPFLLEKKVGTTVGKLNNVIVTDKVLAAGQNLIFDSQITNPLILASPYLDYNDGATNVKVSLLSPNINLSIDRVNTIAMVKLENTYAFARLYPVVLDDGSLVFDTILKHLPIGKNASIAALSLVNNFIAFGTTTFTIADSQLHTLSLELQNLPKVIEQLEAL